MGWGSLCHALRVPRSSFFLVFSALLAVACDDPEAPSEPVITGVNSVRAACELRSRWTRLDTGDCASCRAATVLPACGCEGFRAFEARCAPQADARRAHPECTAALDACTAACAPADCGCLDGCYEGASGCLQATAARDGCVTEVCAPHCE